MKKLFVLLAIVAVSLAAKPAVAHHALQAEFDTAKRGEFTGTLTKFAMINPHVRWFFDVKKPDGNRFTFIVEDATSFAGSRRSLQDLTQGDKVTVDFQLVAGQYKALKIVTP